jgi:hypothetical protein
MFDYIPEDPNCDWLQVHSVMFLNIQFYSSGTRPWNRQFGDQKLGMTEHAIKQFHVMRILNAAKMPSRINSIGECLSATTNQALETRYRTLNAVLRIQDPGWVKNPDPDPG